MLTTLSSWAAMIDRAVTEAGCDAPALFAEAGLDYHLLLDPAARYPQSGMSRLWQLAAAATGNPCIGLDVVRHWHPGAWHALGYAWLASSTLRDALARTVRYAQVVNTGTNARLLETSSHYRFVLGSVAPRNLIAAAGIDAGMATVLHMCRLSYGEHFTPVEVNLAHSRPTCAARLEEYFSAPVNFDASENSFLLDRVMVDAPLATGNREIAHANEQIVRRYLLQLEGEVISTRVKARLMDALGSGHMSEEDMAQRLNMSRRSLQRRLKEQGTSFSALLDETRRELAYQYVCHSAMGLSEIAYLLGFAEPGNFTRAFKRWYGSPPTQLRGAGSQSSNAGGLAETASG